MVAKNWVISADSHVLEPEDLWEKSLGDRYDGHIPKVVDGFAGLEGRFFYLGRKGEAARDAALRVELAAKVSAIAAEAGATIRLAA